MRGGDQLGQARKRTGSYSLDRIDWRVPETLFTNPFTAIACGRVLAD